MKSIPLLLIGIFISSFSFCQHPQFKIGPIQGTFVESINHKDTLIFETQYEGQYPIFLVNRAKMKTPDGYLIPGLGSGPYHYVLHEKTIEINWLLSSDARFKSYPFELSEDKKTLKTVDFLNSPPQPGQISTFIRIN